MADERLPGTVSYDAPAGEPASRGPGDGAPREQTLTARVGTSVLFQLDASGRLARLGPAWEALTGAEVREWVGRPLEEALHPEDREPTRALLAALAAKEREWVLGELRLRTRTGHDWMEFFARLSPGMPGEVLGTLTEVTERSPAPETLSPRERCLAAVVEVQRRLLAVEPRADLYGCILEPLGRAAEASRVTVFEARRDDAGLVRVQQKAEWCAPGVRSVLADPTVRDFPLEAALGADVMALLTGGLPLQVLTPALPREARAGLERRGVHANLLLPLRVHGGFFGFIGFENCVAPRRWSALEVNVLAGAAGALSLALEQRASDARRARTEAALRRSEAGFLLLIEAFPDPVFLHADGELRSVNPAAVRYLGASGPGELLGQRVLSLLGPEHRADVARHFEEALGGLAARASEVRLLRRDGGVVVADLVTLGVLFEGKPALCTVARDFTERKQLQARLMLSDRMAAMGTLAAGIAHELNNPLAYVLANLDFVTHGLASRPLPHSEEDVAEWRQVLDEAHQGAERMRQLVRQLKAFSRVDDEFVEPVELNRVLDAVAQMAGSEVRTRARLVKAYGAPSPVRGNEGKLFQVFLNLVINAAQAIPEGQREANEVRIVTGTDARGWAVAEVSDTGRGISPEHLARLFEPFFTTKPTGEGTGLGLSICEKIIRGLGGDISVESTPGQGTTFRVVLPPA